MVLRGAEWRVPATVIAPAEPQRTRVVVGRRGAKEWPRTSGTLSGGERVVCVDPFLFGDAHTGPLAYLWGLMVSTVAERPLGVQAHQIALATLWGAETYRQPTVLTAIGPRASVAGLCAAALEPRVAELELIEPAATLKRPVLDDPQLRGQPGGVLLRVDRALRGGTAGEARGPASVDRTADLGRCATGVPRIGRVVDVVRSSGADGRVTRFPTGLMLEPQTVLRPERVRAESPPVGRPASSVNRRRPSR